MMMTNMLMMLLMMILPAAAAAAASSSSRGSASPQRYLQGDFEWDIWPVAGYPKVSFDASVEDGIATFKYKLAGTPNNSTKFATAELFQLDCIAPADVDALDKVDFTVGKQVTVGVHIDKSTIATSVHYNQTSLTKANIDFCIRIDYNFAGFGGIPESVNFHETQVTIHVDLTDNFTLTDVLDRNDADRQFAAAQVDYPVVAYFCNDDIVVDDHYTSIDFPEPLEAGGLFQFCVRINDEIVPDDDMYVREILQAALSQPDGPATPDRIIQNFAPTTGLTEKTCGITRSCNVKTILGTKFFVEDDPNPVQLDGVAVVAFGAPSLENGNASSSVNGETRRLVKVPIRGRLLQGGGGAKINNPRSSNHARMLQENYYESNQSPFLLVRDLSKPPDESFWSGMVGEEDTLQFVVVVLFTSGVFGLILVACYWYQRDKRGGTFRSVVTVCPDDQTMLASASSNSEKQQQEQHSVATGGGGDDEKQVSVQESHAAESSVDDGSSNDVGTRGEGGSNNTISGSEPKANGTDMRNKAVIGASPVSTANDTWESSSKMLGNSNDDNTSVGSGCAGSYSPPSLASSPAKEGNWA